MSLFVVLFVGIMLMIPAYSLTKEDVTNGDTPPSAGDLSGLPAFELQDSQITNLTFERNSNNGEVQDVSFTISYSLSAGDVSVDNPYVMYTINDANLTITSDLPGENIWGYVYDGTRQSGVYHVYHNDDGTGIVLIEFYEDYLNDFSGSPISGTVLFDAEVTRDENNNGTTEDVTIGGITVTIDEFTAHEMGVAKTGSVDADGNITWNVTISNPDMVDMGGSVISDLYLTETTNVTVNPQGAVYFDTGLNTYVIADGVTDKTITLTYEHELSDEYLYQHRGDNVNNTVTMTYDNTPYDATAFVWVPNGYGEGKSGRVEGDYFVWTIKLYNNYGRTLNGFSVDDPMFEQAVGNIEVSGNTSGDLSAGTSFSLSGETLTFAGDITDKEITITYKTPISDMSEDEEAQNTATFKTPEDETITSANGYAKYYAPSVSKSANVSNDLETIKYTVEVVASDGYITEGYYVTDLYLEGIKENSLVVHGGFWGQKTEGVDYEFIDTDDDNVCDTIRILTDLADGSGNPTNRFKVEYEVSVSNEDLPGRTVNGDSITFENTATMGDGMGPIGSVTNTTTVEPTYSMDKSVDGTNVEKTDNGDGTDTYVIPWNVTLSSTKGDYAGKTYIDTTYYDDETSTGSTSESKHYYNGDINIKYGVKDQWGSFTYYDLDSSYYTVTPANDGGFTVYFKTEDEASGTPVENCESIKLSYTTTAVSASDRSVYVKNKGESNGNNDEDSYLLEYANLSDTPYEKSGPKSLKVGDLEVVEQGGINYYKIPYVITYDSTLRAGLSNPTIYIKDTLPEGSVLYKITEAWGRNIYALWYKDSNEEWMSDDNTSYFVWDDNPDTNSVTVNYTEGDATATFRINGSASTTENVYIKYYVLVPKTTVDETIASEEKYTCANTIVDSEEIYEESTVNTTIKDGTAADDSNISKTGSQGVTDGYADYSIDINPEGKNISTDGYIEVSDNLYLEAMTDEELRALYNTDNIANVDRNINFDDVKFTLDSINVYEVGSDSSLTKLSSDTYTVDVNTIKNQTLVEKLTGSLTNSYGYHWNTNSLAFNAGDVITFTLHGTPGATSSSKDNSHFRVIYDYYKSDIVFDENGIFTFSVVAPSNGNNLEFEYWTDNLGVTSVDVAISEDKSSFSNITLTLPDGKHLRVVYTYKIEYATDSKRAAIKIKNTASLTGAGGTESSDNTSNISIKDSTSATSFTAVPVKLNKVNLNNININVSAGFNLYKYDEADGCWKVATQISPSTVQIGSNMIDTHVVDTWEDADANGIANAEKIVTQDYAITLDKETLYMIVEVEAPNPYILLNKPKFFVYTEAPSSSVIEDARAALSSVNTDYEMDSYDTITNGTDATATYTIKNRNYIDTSVTKNWTVSSDTDISEMKIVVGLYRTKKSGRVSSLPTDHDELMALLATWEKVDERELSEANNWSYNWYGDPGDDNYNGVTLESGTEDDEVWYYYVAETGVYHTPDGGTSWDDVTDDYNQTSTAKWQIVGSSNFDGDHTLGTVNIYNTDGISVKKIWQDENRNPLNEEEIDALGVDSIELEVYCSTVAPGVDGEDYDERGIPDGATLLTADDLSGISGITLNGNRVVLNKSNNYSQVLKDLPIDDGSNNKYYYYVVETTDMEELDTVESASVVYTGNGSNYGEIFVYNIVERTQNNSVILPHTGGDGNRALIALGMILLFISFMMLTVRIRGKKYES